MNKSKTLDKILNEKPSQPLYHYTSPAGLIGILKNQELWATNAVFQNDKKEQQHAADIAKNAIYNLKTHIKSEQEEVTELLDRMYKRAGSAASRIYISSFSEERNLLSQWRAYCPTGGYSMGFPAKLLVEVAKSHGFVLARCIYDQNLQQKIIQEIIRSFIGKFQDRRSKDWELEENYNKTSWEFSQYIGRYGGVIKHHQFSEEKEWRLISGMIPELHAQIEFREGNGIVVPYFKLKLTKGKFKNLLDVDGEKLCVMAGPSGFEDHLRSMSTQFIMTKYLGNSCHSTSAIPFRTSK